MAILPKKIGHIGLSRLCVCVMCVYAYPNGRVMER